MEIDVIIKELEEVENQIFYLEMKDKWNNEDYETIEKLELKKQKLEEELNERRKD